MGLTSKTRLTLAIGLPVVIFITCAILTFMPVFTVHTDRLSTAVILDLAVTAPLVYYFFIRKTAVGKITVLRVFILGVLAATLLLSEKNSTLLHFIKTWLSPVVECIIILLIIKNFTPLPGLPKAIRPVILIF